VGIILEPRKEPETLEQPLPLFRPEVLASQQQKAYGEILRIRPLSAALLVWLGIALAILVLGVLLLGYYTGSIHASGQPLQPTTTKDGRTQ